MTIRQLVAVANLEAETEREIIKSSALAARIAQADTRGWKKSMDELSSSKPQARQELVESVGEEVDPARVAADPMFQIPEE